MSDKPLISLIFAFVKKVDEATYIYSLIDEGEHVEQDFKYEISDARKIARTLSAFANTQGGRLLIGVKDNGRIAGVRSEEEMYMIEAAARLYCRPEVEVSMRAYKIEGRTVVVAVVPRAELRPVMALDEQGRGWAYVRVADENILATPVHLAVWRDRSDARPSVLTFTRLEQGILNLLSGDEECTFNYICRTLRASRPIVQRILSRFVNWGVVAMRYDGHGFVYRCCDTDI